MSTFIAILGTDTGVGKTIVASGLLTALRHRGFKVAGFKVVETGIQPHAVSPCDEIPDWRRLELASHQAPGTALGASFPLPAAPLAAAMDCGTTVDVRHLENRLHHLAKEHHAIVLEGAGGLFVPFTDGLLWIDLVSRWRPLCLLVGRLGLGTINHSLLSLEALRHRNLEPLAIILSATEEPGPEASYTPKLISIFGSIPVIGPIPHACVDPQKVAEYLDISGLLDALLPRLEGNSLPSEDP